MSKRRLAIPIGDPAGIGCEVALKALCDPRVRQGCAPVLVGDAALIARCNESFGTNLPLRVAKDIVFADDAVPVLDVPSLDLQRFCFGAVAAGNGRALLAYAEAAIRLALAGAVDGVVARRTTNPRSRRRASPSTAIPACWRASPAWTRTMSLSWSCPSGSASRM